MRSLKSKDPKVFWKIVNGSTEEKREEYNKLSCDTFLEYFKSLRKEEDINENDFDQTHLDDNTTFTELLDTPFTEEEVLTVVNNLKNNKACGLDNITNEILKAFSSKLLPVLTNFFNLVVLSGKVPEDWTIGVLKPLYKQKGCADDPNNYRGISLLSCFGKMFTSLINLRLSTIFDQENVIGNEQAGFRSGHSVTDHIFTLHAIIDFFLFHKKKLYAVFIDYEKAFDFVNRSFLWQKILDTGVSGKLLRVIQDMYKKAKSCVMWNSKLSDYFSCSSGVRQGENLSPLLFSIYLNDLKLFLSEKVLGLDTIKNEAEKVSLSQDDIDVLYKLFILLYADDTVIFAESPQKLQIAIDSMFDYCQKWDLKINVSKTKVIIFSRGKIRNLPVFLYDGKRIDVTYDFQYLGIKFNYNGKFKVAQKQLYDRALRAMFALLRKIRQLSLPIDIQLELFDKTVVPILIYGSEVWCPQMSDLANKLQLRFYKMILRLGTSTPSCMVLGELGQFPVSIQAKCRLLSFWHKLTYRENKDKLSCIMYKFLFSLYKSGLYRSPYLEYIKTTINELGLCYYWTNQLKDIAETASHFKHEVKTKLQDQFIQNWFAEINHNELYYNYRMFKEKFHFENYLTILPSNLSFVMVKFRTLNHRLPIQKGRIDGIIRSERICVKCDCGDLGDEFHYLFSCPYFCASRRQLLKPYYNKNPNCLKFSKLLCSSNKSVLLKLAKLMKIIMYDV